MPRQIDPWIVTRAAMTTTFAEILDSTVVNVFIKAVLRRHGATFEEARGDVALDARGDAPFPALLRNDP